MLVNMNNVGFVCALWSQGRSRSAYLKFLYLRWMKAVAIKRLEVGENINPNEKKKWLCVPDMCAFANK